MDFVLISFVNRIAFGQLLDHHYYFETDWSFIVIFRTLIIMNSRTVPTIDRCILICI